MVDGASRRDGEAPPGASEFAVLFPFVATAWKNLLFYGDNLDVLRKEIGTDSIDLIYLDPPFNSKRATT